MVVSEQEIETLLASLEPTHVEVSDLSDGCGAKFNILVVSSNFTAKRVLERHRMVHECLKPVSDLIHAVTIQSYNEEQWQMMQQKGTM